MRELRFCVVQFRDSPIKYHVIVLAAVYVPLFFFLPFFVSDYSHEMEIAVGMFATNRIVSRKMSFG